MLKHNITILIIIHLSQPTLSKNKTGQCKNRSANIIKTRARNPPPHEASQCVETGAPIAAAGQLQH
jgi:hypothetical protein